MNGATRMSLGISEATGKILRAKEISEESAKIRVHVFAESVALLERGLRALGSERDFDAFIEDIPTDSGRRKIERNVPTTRTEILVMFSCGSSMEDLKRVRQARAKTPGMKVLLLGAPENEADFLQYVRSGINGFRPANASDAEIVAATRAVCGGKAVCASTQCDILFRYFEKQSDAFPSAAMHRDLGLTRREQQLLPLLTRGLTNKEIASHFSLSEQTVKNHLYRMKRKVGAAGRLEIVDVCRQRGFLA